MAATFPDGLRSSGSVLFTGPVSVSAAFLKSSNVNDGANIDADKLSNRLPLRFHLAGTVAAADELLFVARNAATIKSVIVRPHTAPSGGDLAYTVDVQKVADGSNSGTTQLNSAVSVADGDSNHTKKDGVLIASPTLAAGEGLKVVVATSGSTGTQGSGVDVFVVLDENGI